MTTETRPALKFDGVDDYIDAGANPAHEVASDLTLEAWIYIESWRDFAGIITKHLDFQGDESGYALMLGDAGNLCLALRSEDGDLVNKCVSAPKSLSSNAWHHVAATLSGKTVTLYIDGESQGQSDADGETINYFPPNNLFIGLTRNGDGEDKLFHGMIGQVRVWSEAKTADQIRAGMDQRAKGDEPNLVGSWPLDDLEGSTAADESSTKQPGTIMGGAKWTDSDVPFPEAVHPRPSKPAPVQPPPPPPPPPAAKLGGKLNPSSAVSAISGTNVKIVGENADIGAGARVLIIQMDGATVETSNDANFGRITGLGSAGLYEFGWVESVSGSDYKLRDAPQTAFDPVNANVQMVKVSWHEADVELGDVSVDPFAPVPGHDDVRCGGVIVVEAQGTIRLSGLIDASERGFAGGAVSAKGGTNTPMTAYVLAGPHARAGFKGHGVAVSKPGLNAARAPNANGGGGGNNHNAGGGGGANCGAGGKGGLDWAKQADVGGLGGYALEHGDRVFFGGGGGGPHQNESKGIPGGTGGGIVILRATAITGTGVVRANGGSVGFNPVDGAGGGGAGGTIVLDADTLADTFGLEVAGGNGGNVKLPTGPGGGGGGGRVLSRITLPDALAVLLAGGKAGKSSDVASSRGATDGQPGCRLLMSPKPAAPKGVGSGKGSTTDGIPGLIDTTGALTAALDRLNRKSLIGVLEKFAAELDEHCQKLGSCCDKAIDALRGELKTQIDNLRNTVTTNTNSIAKLQETIKQLNDELTKALEGVDNKISTTVEKQLETKTTGIVNDLNGKLDDTVKAEVKKELDKLLQSDTYDELKKQIDDLQKELDALEKASKELDTSELEQLKQTLQDILKKMDLAPVLANTKVTVNGSSYSLSDLLDKLASQPQVVETFYEYLDGALSSVTYKLSDGSLVKFVGKQVNQPDLGVVDFVFTTANLGGFSAEFTLRFAKQSKTFKFCDKSVNLDDYAPVWQTNVLYDLGS